MACFQAKRPNLKKEKEKNWRGGGGGSPPKFNFLLVFFPLPFPSPWGGPDTQVTLGAAFFRTETLSTQDYEMTTTKIMSDHFEMVQFLLFGSLLSKCLSF